MSGDDGLKGIEEAIVRGDTERSFQLVEGALGDMDPLAIIQRGMMPAKEKVGDRLSSGEICLPEMRRIYDEALRELGALGIPFK